MEVLNVGIDLYGISDPWAAFALILKAEPYLDRIKLEDKRPIHVHYLKHPDTNLPDFNQFLGAHSTISTITEYTDREQFDLNTAFEFKNAVDAHYINRAYRPAPALGQQKWFGTTSRPQSRVRVMTPTDDFLATFHQIREADMVVTDHCGVALVAAALSVNRILCLEMHGDPALLDGIPEIRRFRREGPISKLYDNLDAAADREWNSYVRYPQIMNEGDAQRFIQPLALKYCKGQGIDVGSNHWPFPGALSCDVETHDEAFTKGPFDFIFSSHCLEHIPHHEKELQLWYDSLRLEGILFVYVPHPLCEVWKPEGEWVKGGWHVWSPDPLPLVQHLSKLGFEILEYSSRPDQYWGFHIVARKK